MVVASICVQLFLQACAHAAPMTAFASFQCVWVCTTCGEGVWPRVGRAQIKVPEIRSRRIVDAKENGEPRLGDTFVCKHTEHSMKPVCSWRRSSVEAKTCWGFHTGGGG